MRTQPYSLEDISTIISIRAKTEEIPLGEESLKHLGQIGATTSLRYAVQLLTPAHILAQTQGREIIEKRDLEEVNGLFYDSKTSARMLMQSEGML